MDYQFIILAIISGLILFSGGTAVGAGTHFKNKEFVSGSFTAWMSFVAAVAAAALFLR